MPGARLPVDPSCRRIRCVVPQTGYPCKVRHKGPVDRVAHQVALGEVLVPPVHNGGIDEDLLGATEWLSLERAPGGPLRRPCPGGCVTALERPLTWSEGPPNRPQEDPTRATRGTRPRAGVISSDLREGLEGS